ncbi:MAG: DUF1501 domain-containing protein [Fuerstiella sp.]|nr:DUF1501 domain-containing protein [Fuerstiella sp.]MCP4508093.1 DUF1501 domain-containing protein [Fuerstiella sp.]
MRNSYVPSARTVCRRQFLHHSGLTSVGLSAAQLARLRGLSASDTRSSRHRANSCVFIFLFGGPSHIDLWDMKPAAPTEIRGEFQPIATSVPGINVCEHLPLIAQQTDKLCLLRSMTHRMPVHGPACSEIYTGRPYFGPPVTDQATPEDWPSLSSLVSQFGNDQGSLPEAAVLPWYTQFVGQDRRIAGQTGGRMGDHFDPFLVEGDPTHADFDVQGLQLPNDVNADRFKARKKFRRGLETQSGENLQHLENVRLLEARYSAAEKLIDASRAQSAFSLQHESSVSRDRYGRTKFGQSLLLARRLVEAGMSMITVNWDDESRVNKVSPHWDTHDENFSRLSKDLCPVFDRAFAAFIQDLQDRGLLETTMVVAVGEFGRTPRIGRITQNGMTKPTGRDHWPHAFTALLAGGGVGGGQVYGTTTSTGGYVDDNPVTPADLTATILRHLGVDPHQEWFDRFQRVRRRLSEGNPVPNLG